MVVGIVGPSGAGKTTGARYLNPKETLFINADGKDLPFKGWKQNYVEGQNLKSTSKPKDIRDLLKTFVDLPKVKNIVLDTANAIMVDDEISRSKEVGFDKWLDIAVAVYDIIQKANAAKRDDLVIFIIFHEESYLDDDGTRVTRILTGGKKLRKIQLETKLTVVLWAKVEGEDGKNEHFFETRANKNTAKSPEGMFDAFKIPNNFQTVRDAMINYYNN